MSYDSFVFPAQNYASALLQRSGSPAIWDNEGGRAAWNGIMDGSTPGMCFFDDFCELPLAGTQTTQIGYSKYKVYATSGSSVGRTCSINSVTVEGGALKTILAASADNAVISQAYASFPFTGTTTHSGKLCFEACVATNVVTANSQGFFLGFAEVDAASFTLATALPFTSATGLAFTTTGAFVGFNLPTNGLGQVKTGYNDRATTLTAVGATDCTVLVGYTFTRLGMVYDPAASGTSSTQPQTCAIRFYQDNVLLPNGITNATLVALTNLNANALGLIWAGVGGSSVSTGINLMKWWRCTQLFPS